KHAELKSKLESSELKLYQCKKDRNLLAVSLDDKQSMLSQNLASVNNKLTELRIHILEQDGKRRMIERAHNSIAEDETLPEIRANGNIVSLRSSFVQLAKEYSDLSSKDGPEQPRMKAITAQMESIKKAYHEEIDGVLATSEKAYQHMIDNEKSLKAMMDNERKEAIELSKIEVDYKPLQRAAEQNGKMDGLSVRRQR